MGTRARAQVLKQGRPAKAEYDTLARKAERLKVGAFFTVATEKSQKDANRARNRIAIAVRQRLKMPTGLVVAFYLTDQHTVQLHCEELA